MKTLNEKLMEGCEPEAMCDGQYCGRETVEHEGRWYITIGHPGFNSPSNNMSGYSSRAKAIESLEHYLSNKTCNCDKSVEARLIEKSRFGKSSRHYDGCPNREVA